MSLAPPFSVIIFDNTTTPVSRGNIGPLVEHLRFSTTLPGGCGYCSFRITPPGLRFGVTPPYLQFNYELRLSVGGEIFWMGRIEDIMAHVGDDGQYWDVTAYGYGVNLDDQLYTSQDVSNTVSSTIATNAITNAPQIDATTITASGFTLSAATAVNLKMMTMAQVVNWAAHFGLNATYNPYLWFVYPDNDGTVRFTFTTRPTAPAYFLKAADCDLFEAALVGRRLVNRYIVQYNDGASNVTVNDTTLQGVGPGGWNVIRSGREFVPEVTQSADATQIANALLTKYKERRMGARAIRLKRGGLLLDVNRAPIDPWRIRAGSLVQVLDIDPTDAATGALAWSNSFLIQETVWDQDAQVLTLTPEHRDLTPQEAFAQLFSVLGGRHTLQAR